MRVHELAKQLNMTAKELIEELKKLNIKVKSHMSYHDEETAEIVRHELEDKKEKQR